jgi:hypothetical protein
VPAVPKRHCHVARSLPMPSQKMFCFKSTKPSVQIGVLTLRQNNRKFFNQSLTKTSPLSTQQIQQSFRAEGKKKKVQNKVCFIAKPNREKKQTQKWLALRGRGGQNTQNKHTG